MTYNLEKFLKGLEELQIELSDNQIQQFIRYYEMLVEKNKVMNLTAITEFDEVIETPIGSGCIAQVYKAHLRGTNQWVALKVKRPEVDIVFSYDLQLINSVAAFLSIFPFMEYLAPKKAAQLFTSTMHDQLDFRKEAVNLVHFRENFRVCVILNDER